LAQGIQDPGSAASNRKCFTRVCLGGCVVAMGATASKDGVIRRSLVASHVGPIPLTGRYHTANRRLDADYELLDEVLGVGYGGPVRRALSRRGDKTRSYAVKELKLNDSSCAAMVKLRTEVEIVLAADHPHIAHLFDVYSTKDCAVLVMEELMGGELFNRLMELRIFTEDLASDALRQMLLAVNYLHGRGIVHRDLKIENFIYSTKGGSHLKLIDFGFSKMWDQRRKMHASCGTLSYIAPEVLHGGYTSQCDLWSIGVVAFLLLAGTMPFSGPHEEQMEKIMAGNYSLPELRWGHISAEGKDFVISLLQLDPDRRLDARAALAHPWIAGSSAKNSVEVDETIISALRSFGKASKFRRCCMMMMAWSLSSEEREGVHQYFLALDTSREGTISLEELRQVLVEKFDITDVETKEILSSMDSNHDEMIHYSDFLAAMLSTRIELHDDLLQSAFSKFDADNSGYITVKNLKEVLYGTVEDSEIETFIQEADQLQDGRLCYTDFVCYLRGEEPSGPAGHAIRFDSETLADAIIDKEVRQAVDANSLPSWPPSHRLKAPTCRQSREDKDGMVRKKSAFLELMAGEICPCWAGVMCWPFFRP